MAKLGVNIDHVATVRQARGATYPDPVPAASLAEMAGADQITCHLRMDRRHISDRDLRVLHEVVQTRLNVELAPTTEMLDIALEIRPHQITLVPEREGEVTTEGGLDLRQDATREAVADAVRRLQAAGIDAAVFADPDLDQVQLTAASGAETIEFNTAAYAEARTLEDIDREVARIESAAQAAAAAGLYVAAGHGLHYHNVSTLVDLDLIDEYNIGHALIARALFTGIDEAVRDMKALVEV